MWGWLFLDVFFAASRNASVEAAQTIMKRWSLVRTQLEVFYSEAVDPRLPISMSLRCRLTYFPDSGLHWMLEV